MDHRAGLSPALKRAFHTVVRATAEVVDNFVETP
jgi:hypothetical protein